MKWIGALATPDLAPLEGQEKTAVDPYETFIKRIASAASNIIVCSDTYRTLSVKSRGELLSNLNFAILFRARARCNFHNRRMPSDDAGRCFKMLSLEHTPTSQLFQAVLNNAPNDHVTLAWIIRGLRKRSFGMVMLLLGLIAMVPGISVIAALLLTVLGFQMVMAHETPILPRFIAHRPLPTHRIAWLVDRSIPIIQALENLVRPRWHTPFMATKRLVGFVVMVLAATLFMPIPLSNVIPGALTMLIAFAYLEEDGVLLCIALSTTLGSLALTAAQAWAALSGADFLLRL